MAGFPSNPTNAQQVTANGITYIYNSTKTAWVRNTTTGTDLTANSISLTSTRTSTSSATGALIVAGGAGIAGNIYASGNITALTFIGNVTGNVTGNFSGTVIGNADTATKLATTRAINGVNFDGSAAITVTADASTLTGTTLKSTILASSLTSVGTLTALGVTGTVTAGAFSGPLTGNTAGTHTGPVTGNVTGNASGSALTVTQASQPAITSVGTLTSLAVNGAITVNSNGAAAAIINGGSTGVGNIGSATIGFNTVFAKSTSAVYADLAENYLSDTNYAAGTVVVFGGVQEITTTTLFADAAVAGVISTNPAYLMNDALDGQPVALRGRVPVQVQGFTRKGDLLVTSSIAGVAISIGRDTRYGAAVFAKALENKTTAEVGIIEAVII